MDDDSINFQYANDCDLEIHCSPFGLSGLYIKIKGTNIIGIGSTMGLITGLSRGLIHYNDSQDLVDQKYKLYVVVDEEGTLRIDFTKIFTSTKESTSGNNGTNDNDGDSEQNKSNNQTGDKGEQPNNNSTQQDNTNVSNTKTNISTNNNSANSNNNNSASEGDKSKEPTTYKAEEGEDDDSDGVPTLIFTGKCPEGRPDKVDPFIGIFSFEREE